MAAVWAFSGAGAVLAQTPSELDTGKSLPVVAPTAPKSFDQVKTFVDSLSSNDAAIEVFVNQGRILTLSEDLTAPGRRQALVAAGDPSIFNYTIVNTRQLRLTGLRIGTTDLSITTSENKQFSFEVRVVADLNVLRGQLRQMFPDAVLKLGHLSDHVVVEGQARDTTQVANIIATVKAYLESVKTGQMRKLSAEKAPGLGGLPPGGAAPKGGVPGKEDAAPVSPEQSPLSNIEATIGEPRIINLIRVPGSQQVLLKVRVAELNRTGLKRLGGDLLVGEANRLFGTQIGGATVTGAAATIAGTVGGAATHTISPTTTLFGVFGQADFAMLFSALRRNSLLKVLAEPNLMAMNGHRANFLAGGRFPVPVPQTGGGGGGTAVTVQFEPFGVELNFIPHILDGDNIRLSVNPKVSTIDFSIGTVLVPGGTPVPGLNSREAQTTVELKQGQTLAIAGLLQVQLDGRTSRVPGLGDLPVIGALFSNSSSERTEKELIILVTPYLVDSLNPDQVPPLPGHAARAPTDLEFFLQRRIESGGPYGGTPNAGPNSPRETQSLIKLQKQYIRGPVGFQQN